MIDEPMHCPKFDHRQRDCQCKPCLICGDRWCNHFDQADMIAEYNWASAVIDDMNQRRKQRDR